MKKRLRKKKHRSEFTEWGCRIVITRRSKDGCDEFLDAFVEEAIEGNNCYCGGGGTGDRIDMVIELGRREEDIAGRLSAITCWLDKRPEVLKFQTGKLFDHWCESYEEIPDGGV